MKVGIILAAGKGTRLKSSGINKTSLLFNNKPLVQYGIDLYKDIVDKVIIVIGAHGNSVRQSINDDAVDFIVQKKRLGTGHAVKVALDEINNNGLTVSSVLVGYGDHMMYYSKDIVKKLIDEHKQKNSAITLISTEYTEPNILAWGRIIRDKNGQVIDNVEQKDATEEQKKITELNAGFYCFDYEFLKKNIGRIQKSPVSGEYYINSLIKMAVDQNKVVLGLKVPFRYVGIGINTKDQFLESERLYMSLNKQASLYLT